MVIHNTMKWTFSHTGILLIGSILLSKGPLVFGTDCSSSNRNTTLDSCLSKIKIELLNPDRFWFDNDYETRCKNNTDAIMCSNTAPTKTSIATRLFSSIDWMNSLDRYVKLVYESSGQDYVACGNHFQTMESWSYDVDPLSDTIVYPWYVKNFPITVDWTYRPGDLFSLIVYDVGYFVTHGVYINIQGDDMTTADVIKHYHGPLMTTEYHNPYIFLLYKQNGAISLSDEWTRKLTGQSNTTWTFENMASDLKLQGPVGANFIVASGDAYAASLMLSRGFLAMCPVFTTQALRQTPREFIPSDVRLTVWMDFNFTNEALNFRVCCKDYSYGARTFSLNPLGNPIYSTADVRTSNPHSLAFRKLGVYRSSTNFTGNTYTLIMFDPDVPSSSVGTERLPLLHGLVTNIRNGDMSTGQDGLEYQGPKPPDTAPHTYYMFLYEQQGTLNATELMMKYDGNNCPASLVGRCLFDINRAVSENKLMLVGATWFRATRDPYVHKRNVQSGATESVECKSVPNYPSMCDTSGSAIMTSSVIVVFVISLIQLFIRV